MADAGTGVTENENRYLLQGCVNDALGTLRRIADLMEVRQGRKENIVCNQNTCRRIVPMLQKITYSD